MKEEKVYIVDYELISPIAIGRAQIHTALQNDVCGESKIESFDTRGLYFRTAAEIKTDLLPFYKHKETIIQETCSLDRKFELTVACTEMAKERFKSYTDQVAQDRKGVILGIGTDVVKLMVFQHDLMDFALEGLNPYKELIFKHNDSNRMLNKMWNPFDIHPIYVAESFDCGAFQHSILTACTSSTQAFSKSFDAIRVGQADLVVTGGTDSIINALAICSFGKLGVIPETDELESRSCLVFDKNRKGTLAGEAAGLMVLVSESTVESQKLTPLAEVVACGNSLDGYKITAPNPSGTYMRKALERTLKQSKIELTDIDYIQAHGTGTRQNDNIELDGISEFFGDHAKDVLISSTKDRHGHAIAAAGVQELSILTNCMEHDFLPSNMNMNTPIYEDMNLIKENMNQHITYGLNQNFAFGGVNSTVLLKNTRT